MFRPNRIGDHPIVDLSATDFTLPQSDAENLASLGTINLHQVQTDTAVLGDPVSCINFRTLDTDKAWVVATKKSWSFGRFITGAALNDREMMISYSVQVELVIGSPNAYTSLKAYMGMANATSVTVDKTAQVNLMDNVVMLKQADQAGNAVYTLNARVTIVNSLFNGGKSGIYDTNPIGVYFTFTNFHASAASTVRHVNGSISIYRYSQDTDTFDPTR